MCRVVVCLTSRTPGIVLEQATVERLGRLDLDHFAAQRLATQVVRRGQGDQSPLAPGRRPASQYSASPTYCVVTTSVRPGVAQTAELGPDLLAQHRVEPGRRLVDEQQARLVHQRARQLQAPLHAARQLPRSSAAGVPQTRPASAPRAPGVRGAATTARTARRRMTRFRPRSTPRTARSAGACSRSARARRRVNLRGSWPSTRSSPLVGRSVPVSMRTSVVLPEPLGPITPRIVPRGTSSVTSSTAATSPKVRLTPRTTDNGRRHPGTRLPFGTFRAV